jgi:hypothetical protein
LRPIKCRCFGFTHCRPSCRDISTVYWECTYVYIKILIYNTVFRLFTGHLDGLLITYDNNQLDNTVTERGSSNMLQDIQSQSTIKKGVVNVYFEMNVYNEPVCNYIILWVIKSSQSRQNDGLFYFYSTRGTNCN